MYEEEFLSEKLQHFSLVDIGFVKIVYLLIGILIATNYMALLNISWIFYILLYFVAVVPIALHLLSFEGTYIEKSRQYLKTNKPSYQVLLFFAMFFLGCTLAVLVPVLSMVPWFVYIVLIVALAIKPMRSNMYW